MLLELLFDVLDARPELLGNTAQVGDLGMSLLGSGLGLHGYDLTLTCR